MANITISGGITVNGGVTVKPLSSLAFRLDANNLQSYNQDYYNEKWLSTAGSDTKTYVFGTDFSFGGIKIMASGGVNYLGIAAENISSQFETGDFVVLEHSNGMGHTILTINDTYQSTIGSYSGFPGGYPVVETTFADDCDINVATIRIVKKYAIWMNEVGIDGGPPRDFNFGSGGDIWAQARSGVYFNGGDFTITAWVNPSNWDNWGRIIDFGNGAGTDNVLLALSETTTGLPTLAIAGGANLSSSVEIPLNTWTHLAVSYNHATSTATMYMDAVQVASGVVARPTNVVRTNCYIGKSNWEGDPYLTAKVGRIDIWNGAMSASNVREDYEKSAPLYDVFTITRDQIVDWADPSLVTDTGFIQPEGETNAVVILKLTQEQLDFISTITPAPVDYILFSSGWGANSTDNFPNTAFVLLQLEPDWQYCFLLPLGSSEFNNFSTYYGTWNMPASATYLVDWNA